MNEQKLLQINNDSEALKRIVEFFYFDSHTGGLMGSLREGDCIDDEALTEYIIKNFDIPGHLSPACS